MWTNLWLIHLRSKWIHPSQNDCRVNAKWLQLLAEFHVDLRPGTNQLGRCAWSTTPSSVVDCCQHACRNPPPRLRFACSHGLPNKWRCSTGLVKSQISGIRPLSINARCQRFKQFTICGSWNILQFGRVPRIGSAKLQLQCSSNLSYYSTDQCQHFSSGDFICTWYLWSLNEVNYGCDKVKTNNLLHQHTIQMAEGDRIVTGMKEFWMANRVSLSNPFAKKIKLPYSF